MSDAKPRRRRSTTIPITFGPDGFVEHWAFEVPRGFRVALDIRLTERIVNKRPVQVMTIGQPPAYGFRPLDLISSRARNPGEPSRWMLRVVDAEPDAPRDGTDGWVLYERLTWSAEERRYLPSTPCKISQHDFAHLLRNGLPEATEHADHA